LYEIVNGFQLIIWPLLNLVEVTTAMIWLFSAVKPDDPSVRKGKMSRRTGFFWFTSFDLPVWAGLAHKTADCGNFTTSNAGLRIPVGVPEARTPASTSPGRLRGTRLPVTTV